MPKTVTMTVVAIRGSTDATRFGSPGPIYLDVELDLQAADGTTATVIRPVKNHPRIGDTFEVTHNLLNETETD